MAAARGVDRAARFLVVGVLLLVFAPRSYALAPAYLTEWPSAEQVLADHQGTDRQDTLARQMAALHHLDRSIEDMADTRRWHGLTPDENRLRGEYYAAAERIRDEVNSTLANELPSGFNGPFAKPPLRKWYALQWKYERDPQVRAQTLGRYLSPPLLAELGAKKSASDARAGEAGRELLDGLRQSEHGAGKAYLVPLGALAALGLLVAVIRGRRRRAASRETASPQSRATDPHPDAVKAAEEVMDSLEPYLVVAKGDQRAAVFGAGAALSVLMKFSGKSSLESELRDRLRRLAPRSDTDAEAPHPTLNAPATRLHPAGPNAKKGEQWMLTLFVRRLTKIISEST